MKDILFVKDINERFIETVYFNVSDFSLFLKHVNEEHGTNFPVNVTEFTSDKLYNFEEFLDELMISEGYRSHYYHDYINFMLTSKYDLKILYRLFEVETLL